MNKIIRCAGILLICLSLFFFYFSGVALPNPQGPKYVFMPAAFKNATTVIIPTPTPPPPETDPDNFEPDNTAATATTYTLGTPSQHHNFYNQYDVDFVKFNATAGVTYVIQTANLGPEADTMLILYNKSMAILANNDDCHTCAEPLSSRIIWTAPATATYYVQVASATKSQVYGEYTYYDLSITIQ